LFNFNPVIPIENICTTYGHPMGVVIQACRVYVETNTISKLNELIREPDISWKEVRLLSRLHRIRPVVYRVLLESNAPTDLKDQLIKELQQITIQNFRIAAETERVINLLALANVKAIPYKGVAYSIQFYGDIAMRESDDIDLVIDSKDLLASTEVLISDGYLPTRPELSNDIRHEIFLLREKDYCFDKTDATSSSFHLEIHWSVIHPLFRAPASINQFNLSRISDGILGNTHCSFLSLEEHFAAIASHHFLQDVLSYLKTIIDLGVGLKKIETTLAPTTKEKILSPISKIYRINILYIALKEILGIDSPVKVIPSADKSAARSLVHLNFNSSIARPKPHHIWSWLRHYLKLSRLRALLFQDKKQRVLFFILYWIYLISPQPADEKALPLPILLKPLYIIIRPLRILFRKKAD
jgi:hypothetical protein